MSKKLHQITLKDALHLKQNMQELLINKREIFKRENCFPINSTRNYDLKKLLKEIEELSQNFVLLKTEIQKANLTIPEGEAFNISTLVYKLSEIKSDVRIYEEALNSEYYIEGIRVLDESEVTYAPLFDSKKIRDWISHLKKEYYYIESQLTKLNENIKIDLPFDPKGLV